MRTSFHLHVTNDSFNRGWYIHVQDGTLFGKYLTMEGKIQSGVLQGQCFWPNEAAAKPFAQNFVEKMNQPIGG